MEASNTSPQSIAAVTHRCPNCDSVISCDSTFHDYSPFDFEDATLDHDAGVDDFDELDRAPVEDEREEYFQIVRRDDDSSGEGRSHAVTSHPERRTGKGMRSPGRARKRGA